MGELQVRGPTGAIMYWNNREKTRETFLGEWTRSGDKYRRGRGRLLRLLRPARRHAQGRRHLCLAVRGRRRALHPCGRAGGRGGGVAGRGRADQAEGLRGAQVGRQGRRELARALQEHVQGARSRPTSIRAGSSFAPSCPRPRPARSSASSCGPRAYGVTRDGGTRASYSARASGPDCRPDDVLWREAMRRLLRPDRARNFRARVRRRRHRRHSDQCRRGDPIRGAAARGRGRHQLDRHRVDLRRRRLGGNDRPPFGDADRRAPRLHQGPARSRRT